MSRYSDYCDLPAKPGMQAQRDETVERLAVAHNHIMIEMDELELKEALDEYIELVGKLEAFVITPDGFEWPRKVGAPDA